MTSTPDTPPLHLTIRFSASHPDLPFDVPDPRATTIAALKARLREAIPPLARRRLRFIHHGRILLDATSLSAALDPKGKGKTPLSERVFLNCSVGDVLPDKDLAEEARIASLPPAAATSATAAAATGSGAQSLGGTPGTSTPQQDGVHERSRRPRGFDRLLATGFTASEINQLRLQFTSIHASNHTPDTMPSADALLDLEDAWIDNNGPSAGAPGADDPSAFPSAGEDGGAGAGELMDVILQGMAVGFFAPLACMVWLLRDDGMWSKRRQVAAGLGVFVSVVIGLFKAISGDAES